MDNYYQQFTWICIIWLFLNFMGGQCEFVITPRNSMVYVGQTVTLDCTIQNAGISGHIQSWREYIRISGGQVITSDDTVFKAFQGKYEIVGQFNLKIKVVELSDGGSYSCEDVLGDQIAYKAELVVLDSDPVMSSSITSSLVMENTQVRYTCQVSYQGGLTPVMEWKNSDGETIEHNERITARNLETSVVFTAGPSNNGDSFSCRTYFKDVIDNGDNRASNTISYIHRLQTDSLEVHYKPRKTKIEDLDDNPINRGSNIFTGAQLRCKTESNPSAQEYVWTNTRNQQVVSTDSILRIGEEFLGEVSLECAVTNHMGAAGLVQGRHSVVVSFNVIGSDKSGTDGGGGDGIEKPLSDGAIIGIALGVAVFLAIVIVVTIILVHRRHHRVRKKTIIEEIRRNEDGTEEVIRRETEIVEPAGLTGTFHKIDEDNNYTEDDLNSIGSTSSAYSSSAELDNNEGGESELDAGQQEVRHINNSITKFTDDDSGEPPRYCRSSNLEDLL